MTDAFEVSRVIHAPAERLYEAWLDGEKHSAMTGGRATVEPDGHFTAWDGYIEGRTLETEPNRRILQAWRTSEFPPGSPDSKLEVWFEPVDGGTKVTLKHSDVPEGQGPRYQEGWVANYFEPMESYFSPSPRAMAERALSSAGAKASELVSAAGERAEELADTVKKAAQKAAKKVRAGAQSLVKQAKRRLAAKTPAKKPKKGPANKRPQAKSKAKKAKRPAKKRR